MPVFNSDGVEIHYIDEGAGEPVLLVHGFASNHRANWVDTGWVRFLTGNGYRVIAMDNRGHGQSAKLYEIEEYRPELMAEDARRLLDHLGIERALVMGFSMGARISALLSRRHPERVKGVVLAGLGSNMLRPMAGTGPIAHALEANSIDDVTSPTARTFRAFAEQTKSDLKALAACIRSSREPVAAEDIAAITTPALVVVGETDVIGGSAEGLAKVMANAEAVTLPGRDHMKSVGDRGYKDAVLAFFRRLG